MKWNKSDFLGKLPTTMKIIMIVSSLLVFTGCANQMAVVEADAGASQSTGASNAIQFPTTALLQRIPQDEGYWWRIRFYMAWPLATDVAWYMDPLIAHRIVAPVIIQNRLDIDVWRFHRRAARDKTGHKFAFLLYSSHDVAQKIFAQIKSNRLLQQLLTLELVKDVTMGDSSSQPALKKIEATSDKTWSLAIQQTWPYFIMGVSESWLRLIDNVASNNPPTDELNNTQDLFVYYTKLNGIVDTLWQQQGGHAYLHHLNALFGYKETYIYERKLMHF